MSLTVTKPFATAFRTYAMGEVIAEPFEATQEAALIAGGYLAAPAPALPDTALPEPLPAKRA